MGSILGSPYFGKLPFRAKRLRELGFRRLLGFRAKRLKGK